MEITLTPQFLAWLVFWFILWLIVYHFISKKTETICIEKIVNIVLIFVWIWMHIYWFIYDKSIPYFFDIVWWMGLWHLVWFDVSEILNKFGKWKKE